MQLQANPETKAISNTSVIFTVHYCVRVTNASSLYMTDTEGFRDRDYGQHGARWVKPSWLSGQATGCLRHLTVHANGGNHTRVQEMLDADPAVVCFAVAGIGGELGPEAWPTAAALVG